MKLQTNIGLQPTNNPLDYQSRSVLLGSCFASNIGNKLNFYKFRSIQNPFGILFHPTAIEKLLARAVLGKDYQEFELFHQHDRWHCFDAHSDVSSVSKKEVLLNLNQGLAITREEIMNATHIFITLGTSWVYRNKKSREVVANCHKVPQKNFDKVLYSPNQLLASLENIVGLIRKLNTKASLIFNVSPVRHLKDGFVENQRSKAHLITAIHELVDNSGEAGLAYYFPSYELMMDELRDYRFYDTDMVHPNKLAIDYIWEKFKEAWISKEALPVMETIAGIQKGLAHKPFNPKGAQHKEFVSALQAKIKALQKDYPAITFTTTN
ncbi:MAG: GSCFA domain-containing protein [Eudoraea sp.]|nr:GSCFA domain-containing protein [Eudoraea sp.]